MKRIISAVLAAIIAASAFSFSAFAGKYTYGDIDKSQKVNSSDALKVLQYTTGLAKFDSIQKALADVNADGKINSSDALQILQLTTGIISEFQMTDKNTKKVKYVDPVANSSKSTISMKLTSDGTTIECTLYTDGEKRSIDASLMGFKMRILVKDGQTYILVPILGQKLYCDVDEVPEILTDMKGYLDVAVFNADCVYTGTKQEKSGNKTYDVEYFACADNSVIKYYFSGNDLKKVVVSSGENESVFEFTELKASVDTSVFEIPEDYKYEPSLKDAFSQL